MKSQNTLKNTGQGAVENGEAISPFVIFQMPITKIREAVTANLGEKMSAVEDLQWAFACNPAGGGTAWALQNLDGEKTGDGALRHYSWLARYEIVLERTDGLIQEGNAPPDCASVDACVGVGKPGGDCGACRFAQFGSGPNGEGQACKQVRQLFFLRQENVLPEIVNLPPSSLKPVRQYLMRLAARALPCYSLITRIGLERAQNPRGITYSRATFTAGDSLLPDESERAKAYATMLKPFLASVPFSSQFLKDHLAEAGEII